MAKIIFLFIFSIGIASICAHPAQMGGGGDKVEEKLTLTPAQREILEKFRKAVADLLVDDYERSDEYLLGYLQSKQWKIFSATQMLKIAKNWKKIHNIEELAKSNFSSEMLQRFPVRCEYFDKKGCPVTDLHFGKWDMAGYILEQEFIRDGIQNILKHIWQIFAKMELRSRMSFPKCHQTRGIFPIQGYNVSHVSEVNSISTSVKIMHDYVNYFPNEFYQADFIHVPDSFLPMVELVKTSVPKEVWAIVKVYKEGMEDWKNNLDDNVDLDSPILTSAGTV